MVLAVLEILTVQYRSKCGQMFYTKKAAASDSVTRERVRS